MDANNSNRAQLPRNAEDILSRRSLSSDFPVLEKLILANSKVLDVGCGPGAITCGAARLAHQSYVIGIDSDHDLIKTAKQLANAPQNAVFVVADAYNVPYTSEFDLCYAARLLQWLSRPDLALDQMIEAATVDGCIAVLDYNHLKAVLEPMPPVSMLQFRAAYLEWRSEAGYDNEIADHLEPLFSAKGLDRVVSVPQNELARKGDTGFEKRITLWADVAASRGHQVVRDGFISEALRHKAESEFREWARTEALSQEFHLRCVYGYKKAGR